jgi:hypothetical protein
VPVEAATGQTGALHDVGNPDAVEAVLPEQLAGGADDTPVMFRHLLSAHLHVNAPNPAVIDKIYDDRHVCPIMMIVMKIMIAAVGGRSAGYGAKLRPGR